MNCHIFVAIFTIFIMIYQQINNDLFDISKRIKSIDKNYFIVFNHKKSKYEVHYKRMKNTYELTIPFDVLDARTIDFVQKTRVENKKKIIDEIEKTNRSLKIQEQKKAEEVLTQKLEETLDKIGE